MTKTTYTLTNGTKVNTLKEAQLSGMGYKATYEPIPNPPVKLTEKQLANRVKAIARQSILKPRVSAF